jgi:hypothetical protein
VCFDSGLDDADTEHDEGRVKSIIRHPAMNTVYALAYDANQRSCPSIEPLTTTGRVLVSRLERLYAVSGGSGRGHPLGFTFSADGPTFGQLIDTWKQADVRARVRLARRFTCSRSLPRNSASRTTSP